ncbi:hypothetical protein AGMMS50289_22900 [Betaproteobacteria bacterium]|nr:hypothetical protein AGMMS50289_22900 [Betaproteobacteria bacterium]
MTKSTWWSPAREVPLLPDMEIATSPSKHITLPIAPELTLVSLAASGSPTQKNSTAAPKNTDAVPVYLIRSALLPAEQINSEEDEPRYQFRLWVVETSSNTIKWAGTQEIGKSEQPGFIDEMGRYRDATSETFQNIQGSAKTLTDGIQGTKDTVSTVRDISTLGETFKEK